jgi:hypothetical protein
LPPFSLPVPASKVKEEHEEKMRDVTLRREEQLRVEQEDGRSVEMANTDFMVISGKLVI